MAPDREMRSRALGPPASSPENSFLNCCGCVAPSRAEIFHRCHSEDMNWNAISMLPTSKMLPVQDASVNF